jgi:hypothetical protein
MQQNYTAVIKQDAGWWIGWIEEVPWVNCQEPRSLSDISVQVLAWYVV